MFLKFFFLFILSSSFVFADIYKDSITNNNGWVLIPHNDVVKHNKNTFYFSLMDNKIPLVTDNVEFLLPLEEPLRISFIKDGSSFYKDLLSLGETSIFLNRNNEGGGISVKYMDILKDEFSHVSKKGMASEYVINQDFNWMPNQPGGCLKETLEKIKYNNQNVSPEIIICHMAKLK